MYHTFIIHSFIYRYIGGFHFLGIVQRVARAQMNRYHYSGM